MASDDLWVLGIHMTKFGKHPDKDMVDLASEAVLGALADGGVAMTDMGVIAAGSLMAASAGIGQQFRTKCRVTPRLLDRLGVCSVQLVPINLSH